MVSYAVVMGPDGALVLGFRLTVRHPLREAWEIVGELGAGHNVEVVRGYGAPGVRRRAKGRSCQKQIRVKETGFVLMRKAETVRAMGASA
jgi:hypothetical protein